MTSVLFILQGVLGQITSYVATYLSGTLIPLRPSPIRSAGHMSMPWPFPWFPGAKEEGRQHQTPGYIFLHIKHLSPRRGNIRVFIPHQQGGTLYIMWFGKHQKPSHDEDQIA